MEWAPYKVSGKSAGPDEIGYSLLKQIPATDKIELLNICYDMRQRQYAGIMKTNKMPFHQTFSDRYLSAVLEK